MGLGVALDDLESFEIRSKLLAASAKVDSVCNVPRMPQPYSFRGGTITDEIQYWNPGNFYYPMQRQFFLRHKPVKEVTSLRVYVTNTQYQSFPVEELVVGPTGILEIASIALSPYGIFGGAVVPNLGVGKPIAKISYTYGYQFISAEEILDPTDALTYSAQNQFWDDSDVAVSVDGALADPDDYTVDRTEGAITFNSAPDGVVQATYGYTLPYDIAQATGMLAAANMAEVDLYAKGLGSARRLRVGEIEVDRGRDTGTQRGQYDLLVPPEVELLLAGWRFITAR